LTQCNLTKPESTFDAIRKSHKNLKPTDAALVSTALVEAGKHAIAVYDGKEYPWGADQAESLARAFLREVEQVQVAEGEKKLTKAAAAKAEPETATLTVHLKPSMDVAELYLGNRDDLKTLVSDLLDEGIEYLYSQTDIMWPWTLERFNWSTLSGGELRRHIKFRAEFVGNSEALELGPGGKRKKG